MPVMLSPSRPNRHRNAYRASQSVRRQQSRSRFDNPYWRPYRNSEELAQQLYDLTHPEGEPTFADLAREVEWKRELEPYQIAVVSLSELLR